MRNTTTPDITEDAGSVQDSEDVPTTSTDGSTGPDGSLALMETEVSRLIETRDFAMEVSNTSFSV